MKEISAVEMAQVQGGWFGFFAGFVVGAVLFVAYCVWDSQ
jgi:hypothetical protein